MEYVILDLEWNGTYSKKRRAFFNEIIEIGAVKVNEEMKVIDSFSVMIRPQIGKKISNRVSKLTHITQDELSMGVCFPRSMKMLKKFINNAVFVSWGLSDIKVLTDNNKYYSGNQRIDFIKKFLDLQEYCEKVLKFSGENSKLGLEKALYILGIDVDKESFHRADKDCNLEYECLKRLFDPKLIKSYVQSCDNDEFYKKINFKNTVLCDIGEYDKKDILFKCANCGSKADRFSDWKLKNKSFRALFVCPKCKNKFIGKIKFWRTYEGIEVKKSIDYESNSDFIK